MLLVGFANLVDSLQIKRLQTMLFHDSVVFITCGCLLSVSIASVANFSMPLMSLTMDLCSVVTKASQYFRFKFSISERTGENPTEMQSIFSSAAGSRPISCQ
jgi:hypothetical protein